MFYFIKVIFCIFLVLAGIAFFPPHTAQSRIEVNGDVINDLGVQFLINFLESAQNAYNKMLNKEQENLNHKDIIYNVIKNNLDLNFIAKFAGKNYWEKMTKAQKLSYFDSYHKYVVNLINNRLSQVEEYKINILSSNSKGRFLNIKAVLNLKSNETISMNYRLRKLKLKQDNGLYSYKLIDIEVDGISMLVSQRDYVTSIFDTYGIDEGIQKLSINEID